MSYYMEIDLHGHTVDSAREYICKELKTLPKDVRKITVIHGYRSGTALRNMVRNFKHPKIERKILGMNQGLTIFIIKQG